MEAGKPSATPKGSRRDFMRKSALGIMGISLSSRTYPIFPNASNKVVIVRHKNAFSPDGHVRPRLVLDMVNRGITELTGAGNLRNAWFPFSNPRMSSA